MPTLQQIEDLQLEIKRLVEDLPSLLKIGPTQIVTINGLSDLNDDLGLVKAGEFRSGLGIPGRGFSGVRIGFPGFYYPSTDIADSSKYNIVGVDADTLQFGLRSSDGVAVAGGGSVFLTRRGVTIIQGQIEDNAIKWERASTDSTPIGQVMSWFTSSGAGSSQDIATFLMVAGGDNEVNVPIAEVASAQMKAVINSTAFSSTGILSMLWSANQSSLDAGDVVGVRLIERTPQSTGIRQRSLFGIRPDTTTPAPIGSDTSNMRGRGLVHVGNSLWMSELSSTDVPGTPDATYLLIYAKDDSQLYWKDDGGVEHDISTSVVPQGVALFSSSDLSIPHATHTTVLFNSEAFDDASFHSTAANIDRITIPTGYGGLYQVNATLAYDSGSIAGSRILSIRRNSTTFAIDTGLLYIAHQVQSDVNNRHGFSGSVLARLNAADFITMLAYQESTGAKLVIAFGEASPHFSAVRLST